MKTIDDPSYKGLDCPQRCREQRGKTGVSAMNRRGWAVAGILAMLYVAAGGYWLAKIAPSAQAASTVTEASNAK
jgi:hypothetical protein